jgi:hypothetical protein
LQGACDKLQQLAAQYRDVVSQIEHQSRFRLTKRETPEGEPSWAVEEAEGLPEGLDAGAVGRLRQRALDWLDNAQLDGRAKVENAFREVLSMIAVDCAAKPAPDTQGAESGVYLPQYMAAKCVGLEESQLNKLCESGAVASREPTAEEKNLYGGKIKRMVCVPDAQREAVQRRGRFRGARKPLDR